MVALSPCDIWATGIPGVNPTASSPMDLLHWNGSKWSLITSRAVPASLDGLPAITATSARDVWVAGGVANSGLAQLTLLAHWNGTDFTLAGSPSPGGSRGANELAGVSAISPGNVWAAGLYSVYDPATLTSVGYPLAEHWDGISWTQVPAATPRIPGHGPSPLAEFSAVKALCGCYVWAVGRYDTLQNPTSYRLATLTERWNGREWSQVPSPNLSGDNNLTAVSAGSRNDAWAVGYHGSPSRTLAEHWNGHSWKIVPTPDPGRLQGKANGTLCGVAVISPDDAWAAGFYNNSPGGKQHALLLHWNGRTWRQIVVPHYGPSYAPNVLMAVSASSAANVIVAGYYSGVVGAGQQAFVFRAG